MALRDRLQKLEGGKDKECEVCGWPRFEVVWINNGEDVPDEERPEHCPECGRQLHFTLTWGDKPEGAA